MPQKFTVTVQKPAPLNINVTSGRKTELGVVQDRKLNVEVNPATQLNVGAGCNIRTFTHFIRDDNLIGSIDGINRVFQFTTNVQPSFLWVFLNGLKQGQNDYTQLYPNKIQFVEPPYPGDILTADYLVGAVSTGDSDDLFELDELGNIQPI